MSLWFTGCEEADDLVENGDTGMRGRRFEKSLLDALTLLGMAYRRNPDVGGPLWDFQTAGPGWTQLIRGKSVNIKISGTKWGFSDAQLVSMLPWTEGTEPVDTQLLANKVKAHLDARGLEKILWLRAKDATIEAAIELAVQERNVERLTQLMSAKNFTSTDFTGYSVRVTAHKTDPAKVGSVAIIIGGKVAMRSEAPRAWPSGQARIGFRIEAKPSTSVHSLRVRATARVAAMAETRQSHSVPAADRAELLIEERRLRNSKRD